ncbi:MAG: hypothetical protein QM820_07770 [Minicystis sp.]
MEDMSSEFGTSGLPMWMPDQLPAFDRGLRMMEEGQVSYYQGSVTLEQFEPSMNAFASIIVPADPQVPGDKAAGDLVSCFQGQGGQQTITFGRQMTLLIRLGSPADFGARISEAQGVAFFTELNAQAQALFGKQTFAQLTRTQQQFIVDGLLTTLTITPITVTGPNAGVAVQTLGRLMIIIVKITYWLNFPEHRVRTGILGFGAGKLIFSDPAHRISNPNDITTVTGFDYLAWHYPLRFGVEQEYAIAFLEAGVRPDSDATLLDLLEDDQNRTLIFEP